MSQNSYKKIPTNNNNNNKPKFESEILQLAPYFAYTNLAISSVGTICRAYTNNDKPMIAFVAFVVIAYVLLEICFRALSRLARDSSEDKHVSSHHKRMSLKITIWLLSTAILFGFACQLSAFAAFPVTVLVFAVVTASCACIFYVYFIHDDQEGPSCSISYSDCNCDDGTKKVIRVNEDNKLVEAILEKV